ncbi:unnamed protein product [Schistosoma margrebowiei]|uniref:Uncharacterized protein n=1 Tax=Schistosoma margrebowiei TaxID=48269 RepID=A0A183LVU2_9TREM|nr:unnamed protein product [Schistosoma margrebowiei]
MVAGDQWLVHTPLLPMGYWSPCTPLVWNPVKVPDIRFSSCEPRKQHSRQEKVYIYETIETKVFKEVIFPLSERVFQLFPFNFTCFPSFYTMTDSSSNVFNNFDNKPEFLTLIKSIIKKDDANRLLAVLNNLSQDTDTLNTTDNNKCNETENKLFDFEHTVLGYENLLHVSLFFNRYLLGFSVHFF